MSKSQKKAVAPDTKPPSSKVVKNKSPKETSGITKPVRQATDKKTVVVKEHGRQGSKQSILITLLQRSTGATVNEMAKATGWQNHSVQGVMSGVLKKRLGLTISSDKEERGRVYRVTGNVGRM